MAAVAFCLSRAIDYVKKGYGALRANSGPGRLLAYQRGGERRPFFAVLNHFSLPLFLNSLNSLNRFRVSPLT